MNDIDRIAGMLQDESIDKQIAAAIVLGELKAKAPKVMEGLEKLLGSSIPALQRHALDTLSRLGSKRMLPKIFPLLTSTSAEVRRAASAAVASVGEEGVPAIRERMATAGADERRALDAILAELGGSEAFSALLSGLDTSDQEAAKAAALAVRHEVKRADARQRKSYLAQTEKFLKQKKTLASPGATAAALKILGYLEDEKGVATLLEYAQAKDQPTAVRQEALIALRFAAHNAGAADASKVILALVDAAEADDRALAQTALHTLCTMELPPKVVRRFASLAAHPDPERARFAIEQLGRQPGAEAAEALVEIVCKRDRRRAELAAEGLAGREEAVPALAKALLETEDADRAWLLRKVLGPLAKKIKPALREQLLEAALEKLAASERGWEAAYDVARDADPAATTAARPPRARKREKGNNDHKAVAVLRLLCRGDHASPDDRYRLASHELVRSRRDTSATARAADEGLKHLEELLAKGFDVLASLRKDRALGLEELYYVGFHFAEKRLPLGAEVLAEVAKKGGRTKLAKMAKSKLELAGPVTA